MTTPSDPGSKPASDVAAQPVGRSSANLEQELREFKDKALQSDLLAQGQYEALTRTVDALARESVGDNAIGEVLRTLVGCLHAAGACVWLIDKISSRMTFSFLLESGVFTSTAEPEHHDLAETLATPDAIPWPEVLTSRKPAVLEDIRVSPDFPLRERLLAQGIVTFLVVPMLVSGHLEGVLNIHFAEKRSCLAGELRLAQALANQAMLAIQLCRLSDATKNAAILAERNRLARDIHDTLAEGLTGVIMQLEAAEGALIREAKDRAIEHLKKAGRSARMGLEEARRSLRALRPLTLRDSRLPMAMETLLKHASTGEVDTEVRVEGERRILPEEWEESLLRITQEAMTNTLKHAKARHFRATLIVGPNKVELRLADDGHGFDPSVATEGLGLVGMRERVLELGGQFTLRTKHAEGTEIVVALIHARPFPIDHVRG
jgi:signal transduction histidine kinase